MQRIGIVGGGAAGARSVERLRGLGFEGHLSLFSAERHLPYDRPPLSKGVLTSASLDTTFALDYGELDVEVRLGEPVQALGEGVLVTDRGTHGVDGVVIATGAMARRLPTLDRHRDVHYLRTVDDADRLRRSLAADMRVVVIGAGWIGSEVASTASALGARVTVVEQKPSPASGLPSEVGRRFVPWFEQAGVRLVCGVGVVDAGPDSVLLSDGTTLRAELVVVGVGGAPAVDWLSGSPVGHDRRGVLVDACLRTDVAGIVAVGDAVCYPSFSTGRRMTIAHRDDAYASVEAAIRSLLDSSYDVPFDPVPYFWSEQFGHTIQMAGWVSPDDELVWRGDPREGAWSACWVRGRALRAVLAVDRPRDVARARRLIAQPHRIDPCDLSDPSSPIPGPTAVRV